LANDHENGKNINRLTKTGRKVSLIGVTILHELCHWGNYNNVPYISEAGKKDQGSRFEEMVYGQIIY